MTVSIFGQERHKRRAIQHAIRERHWQQRFANRHGYFWMPCPLCGHEFSGAEWRDIEGKPSSVPDATTPGLGHGICPSCTQAGLGRETPLEEWAR